MAVWPDQVITDPKTGIAGDVTQVATQKVGTRMFTLTDDFKDGYLDTYNKWLVTTVGAAPPTITEAAGLCTLSPTAAATHKATLTSIIPFALLSGSELVARFRVRLGTVPVVSCNRVFGLESVDGNDRLYFEWEGTSLKTNIDRGGNDEDRTLTITNSFDSSNFHDFEIRATPSQAIFLLDDAELARFGSLNAQLPIMEQSVVRALLEAENVSSVVDNTLIVDRVDIERSPDPWSGRVVKWRKVDTDSGDPQQIFRGPGLLVGVYGQNGGTGNPALRFHDGTGNAAANRVLWESTNAIPTAAHHRHVLLGPIECAKGCYMDVFAGSFNGSLSYMQ